MSGLVSDVDELRRDVRELAAARVAGEAIARDATRRAVGYVRTRELVIAVAGLALTALNVAISVWAG